MRFVSKIFLVLFSLGMLGTLAVVGVVVGALSWYGRDLPDYSQLKSYEPPIVTRVYAGDGRLLAEFAEEKRVFVSIEAIPDMVINAFLSAEDSGFYTHQGLDYKAILRAGISNIRNRGTGKRPEGASTITQQVAKNFLLTNEVSVRRKVREAILSYRMEQAMSKDQLLELYLNHIYLGGGSYGVVAAALDYFNKSLKELTPSEAAFLAALPKAPNNYHPVRKHDAALARRNWVLDRMAIDGHISEGQAELAKATPLLTMERQDTDTVTAPFFAEEVRRELIGRYGDESLYGGGLAVRTTVDPRLQKIAVQALRDGLVEYDKRRNGWRGPLAHWEDTEDWPARLRNFEAPARPESWKKAVVLGVSNEEATIGLSDGSREKLQRLYLSWTKKDLTSVRNVLKKGDVVLVERVEADGKQVYGLRQIPEVSGGIIALDPHTGRVLALQGGWAYGDTEFNRVTQAKRQPGSSFKPFVYLSALERGFTPSTMVLDAPVVIDQGPGLAKWRPENYTHEYYGPTPIRVGVEKSRNLMTVRLAEYIGMEAIAETAAAFGVMDDLKPFLSNALGSGETTLLRITAAYAQFVNGGKKITPTLIDRIQDRRGQTIFRHDIRPCEGCGPLLEWESQKAPKIPDTREQIADPRHAYQIVSMLEGVVQRGTGIRIRDLKRPLAGKTGTTNESRDAWFVGFSPDLAVGVYVGYDEPKSLGKKETGSSVAVPIWKAFMAEALKDAPPTPFRIPRGIRQVRVNARTGTRVAVEGDKMIWEAFLAGTEPTDQVYILDGAGISRLDGVIPASGGKVGSTMTTAPASASVGTGGLY